MHGRWQEIGDGVLVGRYDFYDQGIGAVIGAAGVLVVDTRSTTRQAREVLDDLAAIVHQPIAWFVNTHWHYDHAFGNAVFRPAVGWGHARCAEGLVRNAERGRSGLLADAPELADDLDDLVLDPPEHSFETSAEIDVGDGRTVELRWLGRGHTDADIVVRVPHADVLFAGDLLENHGTPWFGDSYPLEWPATVEGILPLASGAVVPGHGDVADRRFVDEQLSSYRAVVELARRAHTDGLTVDDVLPEGPWDRGPLVRMAIERCIAQLRGDLD